MSNGMKSLKVVVIILVSIVVTALGIDAADTLNGSNSTLLSQLIATDNEVCPKGMIVVPMAQTFSCVDQYEATAGPECPYKNPQNEFETKSNLDSVDCQSISEEKVVPWRYIAREQAATVCLKSGKRLIDAKEWFLIAAGTPDTDECNTSSNGPHKAGSSPGCLSAVGAIDTIGNVWEWTSDDVIAGQYQGRSVPESGYVTQVDNGGFPIVTSNNSSNLFFEDYFWTSDEEALGVLRGGYYGSKSDAGVYSVHAGTLPTSAGAAIGFRCVR